MASLLKFVVVTVFVVLVQTAGSSGTTEDLVRDYITTSMQCHRNRFNPAVTITVVKDGAVQFADGFGHVDGLDDNSNRPTNATLFDIASLSKAMTATLLVKLMQEANIPLWRYIRDSSLFDDQYLFDSYQLRKFATVRDVMSHRLGLPGHPWLQLSKTIDDIYTISNNLESVALLRSSFHYNEMMYSLMARLAERLGGDKWHNLMTSHILQPIGMSDTTFSSTADYSSLDMARAGVDTEGQLYNVPYNLTKKWASFPGAGGILTNALDMAKWMNVLLSHGKHANGQQVIDEDIMDDVFDEENGIPSPAVHYFRQPDVPITFSRDVYLLGLEKGYYRELPIYRDSGSTIGGSSTMMLIPSHNLGIFLSVTGRDKDDIFLSTALTHIADLYLAGTPWLTANQSCDFPGSYFNNWSANPLYIDRTQVASRGLSNYVGSFTNPLYGTIQVTLNSDGFLHLNYGWSEFKLYARTVDNKADQFYMEGQDILQNITNFQSCLFNYNGASIDKLTMTEWSSDQPPVFDRV